MRIAVRELVEFLLRSGDIDNRKKAAPEDALQEGSRIHRLIQKKRGASYQAEVPLSFLYPAGEYDILLEGRADGIFQDTEVYTIEEIKGTYRDVTRMTEPVPVHLAQAKCYAYMFARDKNLPAVRVQMTYCGLSADAPADIGLSDLRSFTEEYAYEALEEWFLALMEQYRKWADFSFFWKKKSKASMQALAFPYPYREGQKELAGHVYSTIYHGRKLFLEAPTGVGKTLSVVFPSVKAMGEGLADKLFYLTAKTLTATVAEEAFSILRSGGLAVKTVSLMAKEKYCPMEEALCNPLSCPYAKGHYDRVNEALYELLTTQDAFGRHEILTCASKYQVCPYELSLDASLFADAVVCDYNYVFDPHSYLRRFFGAGGGNYIFLVDEAHNLVDRGRTMYSASLYKEDFLSRKKIVHGFSLRLERAFERCNKEMLALKKAYLADPDMAKSAVSYHTEQNIGPFMQALNYLRLSLEEYLERSEDPIRDEVLSAYFAVTHFQDMQALSETGYVTYSRIEGDGRFCLQLFCVNPSENLKTCMQRARSTVLFSATLLPIQYYKNLLGAEEEDYEVYAKSIFSPEKKGLFIGRDVTTRYRDRSDEMYGNIASYLYHIVKNRTGNYLAFFPSYVFLREVCERFLAMYGEENIACIVQEEHMDEETRRAFLGRFREAEDDKSLLGFCVLGGLFAEGIDLKGESLIGAIIVGVGLPMVCAEREIVKDYFEEESGEGFAYAYRYPGMNKVMQAAGRVIRTVDDVGIVALLDERFLDASYRRLFPREWNTYEVVNLDNVAERVQDFWEKNQY